MEMLIGNCCFTPNGLNNNAYKYYIELIYFFFVWLKDCLITRLLLNDHGNIYIVFICTYLFI